MCRLWLIHHHHHHHLEQIPQDVAFSMRLLHFCLSWGFSQAMWRPMLSGRRSFLTVRVNVWRGLPRGGPFRCACNAFVRSDWGFSLAMWPNCRSRLHLMVVLISGWPVFLRIHLFVMCFVYGMRKILLRHQLSKASGFFSIALVIVQVSAPYKRIGSM